MVDYRSLPHGASVPYDAEAMTRYYRVPDAEQSAPPAAPAAPPPTRPDPVPQRPGDSGYVPPITAIGNSHVNWDEWEFHLMKPPTRRQPAPQPSAAAEQDPASQRVANSDYIRPITSIGNWHINWDEWEFHPMKPPRRIVP
jgi:hypothetical protein